MKKDLIYKGFTLVADLDGTMLYPIDKMRLVPPRARTFIRDFVKCGGRLIISTGRNLSFTEKVRKILRVPADLNACNGTVIKLSEGKVIHNVYIKRRILEDFERKLFEITPKALFGLNTTNKRVAVRINDFNRQSSLGALKHFKGIFGRRGCYNSENSDVAFNRACEHTNSTFVYVADDNKRQQVRTMIDKEFAGKLKFCDGQAFEVVPFGENKAKSVQRLVDHYKLDINKLYVVGDDANDISSFEAFYLNSFCVRRKGNDEFCKRAKYTIDNFADVEEYLKKAINS